MQRYTVPRDLFYGKGALETLKDLEGKRAFIVTGGSAMQKSGFLQKTKEYLEEAGMEVETFEGVEPDPSVETVLKGAKAMEEFNPDWIVSIGGGSPIDAAKAMWVFYEYPDTKFEDLANFVSFPVLRKKAKFAAIPSTSGTATEVTAFAVITDYEKGIKYPLANTEITPDVAILDPDIVKDMPKHLVAHTGMDALTHAVESYVSTNNSPFTEPLALKAIQMVVDNLHSSFNDDMEAREQMHYAQCLAGQAFSNTSLGIVHSMAHKTGAAFEMGHIIHGYANAMYLPYVIQYNMKDQWALKRYGEIGDMLGFEGTDEEKTHKLIEMIRDLSKKLNIERNLTDFGLDENEFNEKLENIAHEAVLDACTATNPREIDDENMKKLLTCIYKGEDVDF